MQSSLDFFKDRIIVQSGLIFIGDRTIIRSQILRPDYLQISPV